MNSDRGSAFQAEGSSPAFQAETERGLEARATCCCAFLRRPWFIILTCGVIGASILLATTLAETAALNVNSDPEGASVFINGRLVGATPVSVPRLTPGNYGLRLEKEGFETLVRTIEIPAVRGLNLKESLLRHPTGTLKVAVKPDGAEVRLDGQLLGYTPLHLDDVPAGSYELRIQKTNFEPYATRLELPASQTLVYTDFELKDKILAMLRANIDSDPQRVSNYMDLAHFHFANNRLEEAAEVYATALRVANMEFEFPENTSPAERRLEMRLRSEDITRLHEEIRKKSHWPGKDLKDFRAIIERQQKNNAFTNVKDWTNVRVQAQNYIQDGKLDLAQKLYVDHIDQAAGTPMLPQAYIELLTLRLRMKKLDAAKETYAAFYKKYGNRAELLRQAANSVYMAHGGFRGDERKEVLAMSEKLLRDGIKITAHEKPMLALCKFELANVLSLQERFDLAVQMYRESIAITPDTITKELRTQRMVDALKGTRRFPEAREALNILAKSKDAQIALRAKADLKQLERLEPSPEQK